MGHKLITATPIPRMLRIRDAVTVSRIGRTKLYALIKIGALHSVKIGGTRLIPVEALEALLAGPQASAEPSSASVIPDVEGDRRNQRRQRTRS